MFITIKSNNISADVDSYLAKKGALTRTAMHLNRTEFETNATIAHEYEVPKDEELKEPKYLMDQILGRWHQIRTVGMAEYLKAEGESWLFQKMALAAEPDFIYTKVSEK